MSNRELPLPPALMDESQYSSDNAGSPTQNNPLAMALVEINAKLEGIGRLEKNLAKVTSDFTGELDLIKTELANLTDARNKDSVEIKRLQTSFKGFSNDLHKTQENQEDIQRKLVKLDNTSNKNLERINRLEQSNAKLSDDMKLLEERENRRPVGARARVREVLKDGVSEDERTRENSSSRNLSYTYQLNKGIAGLRTHSLLKELRMAMEDDRRKEEDRRKESNTFSNQIPRPGPSLDVDLFGEAR